MEIVPAPLSVCRLKNKSSSDDKADPYYYIDSPADIIVLDLIDHRCVRLYFFVCVHVYVSQILATVSLECSVSGKVHIPNATTKFYAILLLLVNCKLRSTPTHDLYNVYTV